MAKISFDFDGTISQIPLQQLASQLIKDGHEVWITTSRHERKQNKDLYRVANKVGILPYRIHFTNGDFKFLYLDRNNFTIHFDNSIMEIQEALDNNCKCIYIPILDVPNTIIEI